MFFCVGSWLQMAFRVYLNPERKEKGWLGYRQVSGFKRITRIVFNFYLIYYICSQVTFTLSHLLLFLTKIYFYESSFSNISQAQNTFPLWLQSLNSGQFEEACHKCYTFSHQSEPVVLNEITENLRMLKIRQHVTKISFNTNYSHVEQELVLKGCGHIITKILK